MIGVMWAIFRGSMPLQIATAALLAFGAFKANNAYQRHVGAQNLSAKIEKKADANVKNADAVRDAVGVGSRGVRHPYVRKP